MKSHYLLYALFVILSVFCSCKKDPHYRIGVSQCSEDDWRMLMNEEIEQEIMFYPEAQVEIRSASDNNEKQIADIRYFIDNNFDIIIAAPNEAEALAPIVEEAYDKGIPVLIFDRGINSDKFTAFQGADNEGIGRKAAEYVSSLLPEGGKIIELRGLDGSTPSAGRCKGFDDYVAHQDTSLSIVASVSANWNYDDAVKATDSLLSIYPDVDIIYAHNDRMALGAADVAAKKGLSPYIIGIDAAPQIGMKAVADGKIDATFLYPTEGEELIKTAMAILKGNDFERITVFPVTSAVDKKNIDLLLKQADQINQENERLHDLKSQMDDYWSKHNSQTALLYAAIAILLLVCIVLFLVLRTFWQHRRHRAELLEKNRMLEEQRDLEKDLNRRLETATQSKLRFFTNVSHDLRTPLTLIAEPIEQIAKSRNLTEQQKLFIKLAVRNTEILRRLINQILDFRKFENDKLDLNLEEASPALFAKEWTGAFHTLANKKHIDYEVTISLTDDFTMALDIDKVERIVFNLLSNAFKFTPVKGKIAFSMYLEGQNLKILVTDNGRGISAENLRNIFDRFYQVDKVRPEGSGIGLSLAKAFVELHDGMISVESIENEGSEFTILLPVRHVNNAVSNESINRSSEAAREVTELIDEIEDSFPSLPDDTDDKPVVLVIDDNEDVRILIRELLKDEYRILSASGGKEGLRFASRYVPDIIICDVMMPGMDGIKTCNALKSEVSTSHIPVLMLTACSMEQQRVEGYQSGADGYMDKPFNSDVLRARISSLLFNRKRIREGIASKALPINEAHAVKSAGHSELDHDFYTKFVTLINNEMGNIDLSVDILAEKMGMGRSQFYRKIKALTGLSPIEVLRDLRLKKARELLLSTDKTVSEIAYEVGFSTPAYFTKCYREVYSETPTALRERMK